MNLHGHKKKSPYCLYLELRVSQCSVRWTSQKAHIGVKGHISTR